MFPLHDGERATAAPLPWEVPPSDAGHAVCGWCGRAVYVPAVPCSVHPSPGLLHLNTGPGLGDRCKWEVTTRQPVDND